MASNLYATNTLIIPHSLKLLDVGGQEMVLLQVFVKGSKSVSSLNDHIGVSQKEKQVSLYLDHHNATPALKGALSKKSYIRNLIE